MGAQWRGEIAGYCRRIRPHVGVVTAVGPVHLELFGSLERVQQAKAEVVQALPARGTAVLNGDDPRVRQMSATTRADVVTYGVEGMADVLAQNVKVLPDGWTQFDVQAGSDRGQLKTQVLGQARGLCRACCHRRRTGIWNDIARDRARAGEGSSDAGPPPRAAGPQRLDLARRCLQCQSRFRDARFAVPRAVGWEGTRIAVFGDMLELGEYAAEEHRLLGEAAARYADRLVTIGNDSAATAAGARAAGMDPAHITEFAASHADDDALEAALDSAEMLLKKEVKQQDVVLIKGSHGMDSTGSLNAGALVDPAEG